MELLFYYDNRYARVVQSHFVEQVGRCFIVLIRPSGGWAYRFSLTSTNEYKIKIL